MINLTIPGQPQGKARARTVRNKHTGRIHSYTPEKTELYENLIKMCFIEKYKNLEPTEEPLIVQINAIFQIPKSMPKKRREQINLTEFPTKKPDSDNIAKVVCDSLNGLAYKDDKQIVSMTVNKFYAETPRVDVFISTIKNGRLSKRVMNNESN